MGGGSQPAKSARLESDVGERKSKVRASGSPVAGPALCRLVVETHPGQGTDHGAQIRAIEASPERMVGIEVQEAIIGRARPNRVHELLKQQQTSRSVATGLFSHAPCDGGKCIPVATHQELDQERISRGLILR